MHTQTRQLIIDLSTDVDQYQEDDYMISSSNHVAYDFLINQNREEWGYLPYSNILLLIGDKGSGKTFLSKMWARKKSAMFINHIGSDLDSLLAAIERADDIVIDDIDKQSEEGLFHIFSAVKKDKKTLLTAARMSDIKLLDLKSRLQSIKSIPILQPDDHMLMMIIYKSFSQRSIIVPTNIVSYLLKVIPRTFEAAHEYMSMINHYSSSKGRKITIPLLKEVITGK